jgi:excinuclease Cho
MMDNKYATVPYIYPHHLKPLLDDLPQRHGVYLFFGKTELPLYIGKSINIRSRVMDHFRNADEASLLRQIIRLEYQLTAGEIGALLLESELIKKYLPIYNKRLRRTRSLCCWHWQNNKLHLKNMNEVDMAKTDNLFGLFRSRRTAQSAIIELANTNKLCLTTLGLEKSTNGRPCFRSMIRLCGGACCGKESVDDHTARAIAALEGMRLQKWPFDGAICIRENHADLEQYHVIKDWYYLGSAGTIQAAQELNGPASHLDMDTYKILVKPILSGQSDIIPLPA